MDHIFDNVGIDASLGTKLRVPNKDYASFPSAALHQGGFHFDTSTNAMYYSDGTTWTKVGTGTVTGFSAGSLSPLFTTSVDFSTTTPHLNFILNNTVSQYQVFGRSLSGVGSPDWVTLSPVAFTGAVTSVALSMPTGFTVSGSPITSAGTLAVSMAAGYVIPTTTQVGNWNTAYGWGNHASANYYKNNFIQSYDVGSIASIDSELTGNGGFLTSYYSPDWAGSDRPFGAGYGGVIRFNRQYNQTNIALDLYFNNVNSQFWWRTKNNSGLTEWKEFADKNWVTSQGYTTNTGTVTSVGASISGALSVTGSPITTSGTLAFSWTGTSGQYVRGDGSLATFPSIPAGTVTSVGLSMPTGFTVSGSPITSAGTLAVSMAAGYVIPTTTQVGNWNTVGVPNSLIPFGNAGGTGLTYDYGFSNTTTLLKKEITSNSANTFQLRNNDTGSLAYVRFLYNAYGNSWGIGMGSYAANANAIEFRSDAAGANTLRFKIETDGNVTAPILSGSGTRMVVANSTGLLSTQTIPSGSNSVWYIQGTATDATTNAQDIVRTGRVRIGATGTSTYMLSVVGDAYIMNGSIINNNMSYAAFSTAVSPITLAKLDTSNRVQLSQSGVDIILPSYLSSRADSISPVNFLCTTASGVLQSRPVSDFTSSFAMTYASSDVTITSGGGWVNLTFPNTNYALNTTSIYSVDNAGVIVIPNVIKYHRIDVTLQWETTSGTSGSPVIEVRCQVNNTNIYNNPTFIAKPTGVGDIIKCHFYTASTGTVTISCRVTSGASCYIKTRTLSVEDRGNAPG